MTTQTNQPTELEALRELVAGIAVPTAPTALLDAIADALAAHGPFRVRGGATFGPDRDDGRYSVNVETSTVHDMTDGEVLGKVTLHIYGAMTYRDRTDRAACVNIGQSLRGDWHSSWTTASVWNGHTFAAMPDGARRLIGDAVDYVASTSLGCQDWHALAAESVARDRVHTIEMHIGTARRAMRDAVNLAARVAV